MWVQLSHSANTSPQDDLICSLGQLPSLLPRWALRSGNGAGAADPFPSLSVSLFLFSLKGLVSLTHSPSHPTFS